MEKFQFTIVLLVVCLCHVQANKTPDRREHALDCDLDELNQLVWDRKHSCPLEPVCRPGQELEVDPEDLGNCCCLRKNPIVKAEERSMLTITERVKKFKLVPQQ
jgi:hypothetical protein